MLAAAQAPRQRIVLPQAARSQRAVPPASETPHPAETRMDDWGDLTAGSSPSFVYYAGLVVGGAALIACAWLVSVHLPELLERLGA